MTPVKQPTRGPALLAPIVAHRGASGDAPENTLAAIRLAAEQGACCIEIDVSLSSDDVPFVHHDDKLDRCTSGKGRLRDQAASELDKLSADKGHEGWSGEPLPRLAAVVDLCIEQRLGLNLEIKPLAGLERETANVICQTLRDIWPDDLPFVFSSFAPASLDAAREQWEEAPRALLVGTVPDDWPERLARHGCRNIHCAGGKLDVARAQALRDADVGIYCYTVNDIDAARRLFSIGVHGVFTDYPASLMGALPA